MNQNERCIIINRLKVIVGSKVGNITRNHGDIWIDFVSESGKEYVLLMQTLFRFCDTKKVLITDMDKYKVLDSVTTDKLLDDEACNWDVQGQNIFDKWIEDSKTDLLRSLVVQDIKLNTFGDLKISFNHNIILTVYLEVTNDEECWHFFEKDADDNDDVIVLGNSIIVNTPR